MAMTSMWDHTISLLSNELEDSGMSPVDYWAEDNLGVWTGDLFLTRALAEKKGSFANFSLGTKFGIEGFINQSVLFGNVKHTGLWEDIDNILWTDPATGEIVWHDVYTGEFFFSKDEEVALPVTELKLKVLYHIRENISISCGIFYSIWWNAPVAPKWSVPGDWTSGKGTGWRLQERTLKFGGLIVDLAIRF